MDDTTDKPQGSVEHDEDADVRMIWQSAPAVCARCSADLYAPRPTAKLGDELLCYNCTHRALRPERFYSNYVDYALDEPPDGVIFWWNERGECSRCSNDLRTPGPVGVIPNGPVCWLCFEYFAPTLAWILRLARGVQRAQGYWPGMPRRENTPWLSKTDEPTDWREAKGTHRWPRAMHKVPGIRVRIGPKGDPD